MLYIVRHEFKNGEANFIVDCKHFPSNEELNDKLCLNFEPEKEEYLIIEPIDEIIRLE